MKYLRVNFGDNDFGRSMVSALKQLWEWIYDSNHDCLTDDAMSEHFSNRTLADIFVAFDSTDMLVPMIKKLYVLEYLKLDVEHVTRGLYWKELRLDKKELVTDISDRDFLRCDLRFYKDGRFKNKWNNGESAYLDLSTGEVETF